MRICTRCKTEKSIEEFYKSTRGKYIEYKCKKCHKEYRLNNLDRINARKKIYENTKHSFLLTSYYSMTGQYRRKIRENFSKDKLKNYEVSISKKDFLDMVDKYEKENGFICQITNMPLTHLRHLNKRKNTKLRLIPKRLIAKSRPIASVNPPLPLQTWPPSNLPD
jgi:transposase-like protein